MKEIEAMEINQICEDIIQDITSKSSIADILLKTQILSSLVDIEDFSRWLNYEQNGYPEPLKVPEYRKLGCNVTASVTLPFHAGTTEMHVPVDAISHEGAREMLSKVYYDSAAVEAELLAATGNEGRLRKPTPGMAYQYVQELFPNAHVEAVFQDLSPSSFATLIESIKSRILNFILGLNKEGVIQLRMKAPKNKEAVSKIYYQIFNNSIVSNDGATMEAESILLLNRDGVSEKDIHKLQTMFSRLSVLIRDEDDPMLQEAANTLNKEINKPEPQKSVIKQTLAIIKGLAMGVASSEIATIINAALGLM